MGWVATAFPCHLFTPQQARYSFDGPWKVESTLGQLLEILTSSRLKLELWESFWLQPSILCPSRSHTHSYTLTRTERERESQRQTDKWGAFCQFLKVPSWIITQSNKKYHSKTLMWKPTSCKDWIKHVLLCIKHVLHNWAVTSSLIGHWPLQSWGIMAKFKKMHRRNCFQAIHWGTFWIYMNTLVGAGQRPPSIWGELSNAPTLYSWCASLFSPHSHRCSIPQFSSMFLLPLHPFFSIAGSGKTAEANGQAEVGASCESTTSGTSPNRPNRWTGPE